MRRLLLLGALLVACSANSGDPPPLATPRPTGPPVFSRAMVALTIETRNEIGGQIHVHFVNQRPGADLALAAEECVVDYTQPGQYRSAFCFAYDSHADLERAAVNKKTSVARRYCWRASYALAIDGGKAGGPNASYAGWGCPGEKKAASPKASATKA